MSNHKNRIEKLEDKTDPPEKKQIFVYYHDKDKGYSASPKGEYFASLDELSAALKWTPKEADVMLSVRYTDARPNPDVQILIPDNDRPNEK